MHRAATLPPLIKAAMEALGRPGTGLRSPHEPVNQATKQAIAAAVKDFATEIEG